MAYQVIARKWRPQRFADVVGQGHITKTLTNAIVQGRTAHAYLFVGPRGIGKTSSARIFAKALNCHSPVNGEPCCQCQSCLAIASNNSIDIIEIDAASNNSVQSMRELCDEVMYAPVNSRYKIYIIDEVHMLTAASWNALLKTVEEPPEHVKFIFATTEVHKVLATILSRCQRFDLRRIPSQLICDRLRLICDTENVPISDGALAAIARAADGGMRDAQSLLDQMVSFFSASEAAEISEEQVLSLFGLTESLEMEKLVHSMIVNDRAGVVTCIYELAYKGKDLEKLFEELLSFLRGIQLCHILPDPGAVLETGAESVEQLRRLAAACHQDVVQRLLETLSPVGYTLHNALNKQVFLETIILKAMRLSHALQVDDLVRRLNQIRKNGELDVLDAVDMAQPLPVQTAAASLPTVQPVIEQSAPAEVATIQEAISEVTPVVAEAAPVVETVQPPAQEVVPVVNEAPVQNIAPAEVPIEPNSVQESNPAVDNDPPPWNTDEAPTETPVVEVVVTPDATVQEKPAAPTSAVLQPGGLAATIPTMGEVPVRDASQDDVNPFANVPPVEPVADASGEALNSGEITSTEVDFLSGDSTPNEEPVASVTVEQSAVAVPAVEPVQVSQPVVQAQEAVPVPAQEFVPPSMEEQEPLTYSEAEIQQAESNDSIHFVDFDAIVTAGGESNDYHYDEVAHMKKLKEEASSNPLVQDAVELFEGEIVDVHSSRSEEKH